MNSRKRDLINSFLRSFIPAVTYTHQYTSAHPLAATAIKTAYDHLMEAIGKDPALAFMVIDDRIVVHDEPLEDTLYSSRFIRVLKNRGVQHIRISQEVTVEEMNALVQMFGSVSSMAEDMELLPHVQLGKVTIGFKAPEGSGNPAGLVGATQFGAIEKNSLSVTSEICQAARSNGKLPVTAIKNVVNEVIAAIRQESAVLTTFSPLRVLDEYTFTHSTNVCILNVAQAMALGIKGEALRDIGVAALLHDTGKLFVSEEVLNKPGKLTETEWAMIREHPRKGAEYLLDNQGIPPLAVVVAYEHHMQYDGSGYPTVAKEWRQNICSHMTTISDYFDALRTKRIYRDAIETKLIADQMEQMSGTAFNPLLMKNFLILVNTMMAGASS